MKQVFLTQTYFENPEARVHVTTKNNYDMEHACFTLNTNLYRKGQLNNLRNLMKNMQFSFLKKWGAIVCFLMAMVWSNSISAIDLTVNGITNPTTAKGTYIQQAGLIGGKNYWRHTSGSYYIYFDNTSYYTWNIDIDTDYLSVLFYSAGNEASPVGASYTAESGSGTAIVTESGLPEITVLGNSSSIGDANNAPQFGLYTKFGSLDMSSGTVTRTYTIKNDGTADLTITGVTFSGANTGDFAITTSPVGTITASNQATLAVRFDPSAVGSRTATINIACNDADEATYNFDIQGYGFTPSNLVVYNITNPSTANGVYTHQGVLSSQYEYWRHSSGSYYIYRKAPDGLNYKWIIDTETDVSTYLFTDYGISDYSPITDSWIASIGTGSPNVVSYIASPEIVVLGNATSIDNNDATPRTADHTHFGTAEVGTGSITRTFTIQNAGGTNLQLTGSSPYIALSGTNAPDFTVAVLPTTPMTSGNSTTFQITFAPTGEGSRTATISIANNDGDENPYTFSIQGGGVYAKGLTVTGVTNNINVNGDYSYQGITDGFATWVHTSGIYRIYNSLYVPLDRRSWRIDTDTDPDNGVCFASPSYNNDPAPIGIVPSSWALGTISGYHFNGNPVVVYYASEINIHGNGNSIASGNVTPITTDYTDYGSVLTSSGNISRTYTIQNSGIGSLYLTGSSKVALSGTNASDFSVTTQPTSPVAATSGSTTFTVLFDPSAKGVRTATISIINDDNDESPYTFSIQGTGLEAPTVTTQAISAIAATTATGNGNITSLGVPNPTQYGVVWSTSSNPTVALTTKTTQGEASATGAFTSSITGLTANTNYYVNAYATNTAGTSYGTEVSFTTLSNGTFTAATNNDWGTSTNWAGGSVPSSATDVTIPSEKTAVISASTTASCRNINITGSLTIQSSASETGSLVVSGTSSGSVTCERYMTNGKWHLISPIASGQTVAAFLTANTNIPTSGSTRGMMDYNTLGNTWNSYFPTTSATGTMNAGKGYSARIATTDAKISFIGTLTTGTKTVALITTGEGWNCVGNPYTSAINMNTTAHATNNFITVNSSNFDASYACVYVWDEDASYTGQNCYKIISNSGFTLPGKTNLLQNYLSPGQGFFVKANTSATNISFTSTMQSQLLNTTFRVPAFETSWPGIALNVESADASSSAIITFNKNMTNGLDCTYDAGLLRGTNGLSLYTRLLDDNGVDFAIQCLPENYDNLVIPVGVDCKDSGEITFSSETIDLPENCNVILEDRTNKIFTPLTNGATYKTTVLGGPTPIGRFFIHTSDNFTTSSLANTAKINNLKTYTLNGKIIIEGDVTNQAIATLYTLQGSKIIVHSMQKGSLNILSCPDLISGIYLLTIQEKGKKLNRKLIMK